MGSKRAQKAKKRTQRQAKRQVRRAHNAAEATKKEAQRQAQHARSRKLAAATKVSEPSSTKPAEPPEVRVSSSKPAVAKERGAPAAQTVKKEPQRDPHIGYVAGQGMVMICDGDACIVAGSQEEMRHILERLHGQNASQYTIQAAGFQQMFQCMHLFGAAYCFDEEAYGRFLEPARRHGMPLTEQDFSDPGPLGMHFVRVQRHVQRSSFC